MKQSKFLILVFFLMISRYFIAYSQLNSTTYFMYNYPQANLLNPATQPRCNVFVGFPGISMLGLQLGNNAISFNDIFYYEASIDSFITPLHPLSNKEDFLNRFSDINFIRSDIEAQILNFGFRAMDDMYFSFNLGVKATFNFNFPKDFIGFLLELNSENENIDLSGFGGNVTAYREIGFGVSKRWNEMLTFGGRAKILFGMADFSIRNQEIFIETSPFEWNINSKFDLTGSFPFIDLYKSDGEVIDSFAFSDDFSTSDLISMVAAPKNIGFGIDLGVHYTPIQNLTLSASVVDLGFIRWSSNNLVVSQNSVYEYKGVEISFEDSTEFFTGILDSIVDAFDLVDQSGNYTAPLTGKVYLGGSYFLTEKVNFGLLAKTDIYRGKLFPQVSLSANVQPLKGFSASLSYSVLNRAYYNIGLGLGFKAGPLNINLISDTYPLVFTSGTPIPIYMKSFRFQFGINLLFGCNKRQKSPDDLPLLE